MLRPKVLFQTCLQHLFSRAPPPGGGGGGGQIHKETRMASMRITCQAGAKGNADMLRPEAFQRLVRHENASKGRREGAGTC